MSRSKLFEILELVKGPERRDLEVFIQMPGNQLSETEKKVAALIFEALGKRRVLDEEKIFTACFKSNEKLKWNRVKNRLYETIKRYFLLRQSEENLHNAIGLLRLFSDKDLQKTKNSLNKRLWARTAHTNLPDKYLFRFQLLEMANQEEKQIRQSNLLLEQMETALDKFYFENKLRIICEHLNRSRIVNTAISSYDPLMQYLKINEDRVQTKHIKIYQHLFHMMAGGKTAQDYYETIRREMLSAFEEYEASFSLEIIEQLMNFCIRSLNNGHIDYARHYIEHMDQLIQKIYLPGSARISKARFKNYITACLIINRVENAKAFLQAYNYQLDEEVREEVFMFNKASIEFYEEDYESCAETLRFFKSADIYYTIACNKLLLKLRCEEVLSGKGDPDVFKIAIASQKRFLRNKKQLNPQRKQRFVLAVKSIENVAMRKPVHTNALKGKLPIMDILWIEKKQQTPRFLR